MEGFSKIQSEMRSLSLSLSLSVLSKALSLVFSSAPVHSLTLSLCISALSTLRSSALLSPSLCSFETVRAQKVQKRNEKERRDKRAARVPEREKKSRRKRQKKGDSERKGSFVFLKGGTLEKIKSDPAF